MDTNSFRNNRSNNQTQMKVGDRVLVTGECLGRTFHNEPGVITNVYKEYETVTVRFDTWRGGWY